MSNKFLSIALLFLVLFFGTLATVNMVYADESMLSKVRVFYRSDGGVSVMYFLAGACREGETETRCMNRITSEGSNKDLPYDDLDPSQLPQSRENRDEWRGEKGRGVWVDESLVTKNEKMEDLKQELDLELNRAIPDPVRALKLQRNIERLKELKAENNLLSIQQINQLNIQPSLGGIKFENQTKQKIGFWGKLKQFIKFIYGK